MTGIHEYIYIYISECQTWEGLSGGRQIYCIIYEIFDNLMISRVNARYTRLYLLTLNKYWSS